MNKNIIINGKYSMMKLKKQKLKREICKKWNIDKKYLIYKNQICLLNECFLNYDEKNNNHKLLINEIKNKINSYKNQDKTKIKFSNENFICLEKILELLITSKLKCYYCREDVYLFYEYVKESKQWSLDRINNTLGHNDNNCVISCLECNLKRRDINKDKFKFTKQMKLIKLNN